MIAAERVRCGWAKSPLAVAYHDLEWGIPLHDDRALFEFLILEGAQAGLSWETILKKRDNYRLAFDGFDARRIAESDQSEEIQALIGGDGLKRDRALG